MPRLNVGKVLSNAQFRESYKIERNFGEWQGGRFVFSPKIINIPAGTVIPGGAKDILQVPEADRTSEIMIFFSTIPIYVSSNEQETKISDYILYKNHKYRIYQVKNWDSYGYYRAIGISMEGD